MKMSKDEKMLIFLGFGALALWVLMKKNSSMGWGVDPQKTIQAVPNKYSRMYKFTPFPNVIG